MIPINIFTSFEEVDDDDLMAEVLAQVTEEDTQTAEENRAEWGEYNQWVIDFLKVDPPKKVIEVELKDGPFKGRKAQAVASGFRNAFERGKIKKDRMTVITRTNAEGRTAVYLINVKAARNG
ncbi:MAG TPA: hypothetical protein VH593_08595 [Ktedonobacteraceae bacterium]